MENISGKTNDGVLTLYFKGRIDSSNAAAAEAEVNALREENKGCAVVIDCEELEYISSAGLRIVLRVRKDCPELKIVNVSSEVYDILDMTGFTEMIEVQKAFRRLSVDGCEVIGQGANGMVYRIDRDTIVKVYRNPDALPDIKRERELARRAFVLGIPTAIPYDVVRVGEGYGSVFELLNAKSFAKLIQAEPEKLDEVVRMSVDLLKKIHSTHVGESDMPDMKKVALDWADFLMPYLPADIFKKLVKLISEVPDTDTMMHGDYHFKNIMLQNGEALLIDMDTLCTGDPVFEFGSVYNAYVGFASIDHTVVEKFIGLPFETTSRIWDLTVRYYFDGADEKHLELIKKKAMIIGFTRIMRRRIRRGGFDTEEGRAEIENCKKMLCELIPQVDTLCL